MYLVEVLLQHYIMIALLVGLWMMLDAGVHVSRRTVDITRVVITLIILEAILWSTERWTRELDELLLVRPILTATIYLIHPLIVVAIIDMAELITKKIHRYLLLIPIVISAPILYLSHWKRWIFWYSQDNLFVGAPGLVAFYPYFLFFVYVVIFVVAFYRRFATFYRRARGGILYCTTFAMLGVLLHVLLGVDTDYSTLFSCVLVLYYLFLYINTSRIDTLTGLMNRQCYYADSISGLHRISCVVSVDMNDLKKINDSQGHAAGDTALKTVAACLIKGAGREKNIYRIGGDEFAIFYYDRDETFVQQDLAVIKERLSKTPYVCAFGYEMVDDERSLDDVMREADRIMYAHKAKLKNHTGREMSGS